MQTKAFLITGIITGILFIILDMLFAITTAPFYSQYQNLPVWNIPPNVLAGMIFDLINGFILAGIYMVVQKEIPGTGWSKGFNYGIMIGLVRVVMCCFSTIVMYNIPIEIVLVSLISGFIEVIILCMSLSLIHSRFFEIKMPRGNL